MKRAVVVGCGGMGRVWIKNVLDNPRVELVGVVDLRLDTATAAAREFGVAESSAFADVGEAIAALRPDLICDITVPESHATVTTAALDAGVPVIGEKPLAHSMEAALEMLATAERSGRLLMTSQSRRYDDNHRALRTALASGAIGQITTVCCDFFLGSHFGGFRDEMMSPLVLEMAIHHFDMCRFLTGLDPVSVYAHEFNPRGSWYRGDASASVIFELVGGVVFTYRGSWCAEGCPTSWNGDWRIVGDRGTLLYDRDQFPRGQRVTAGGPTGLFRELEDVPVAHDPGRGDGIAGALNEFLDALERGMTPQGEVHDNIRSLAMVFAALESSRVGARVPVSWQGS